MSQQKFSRRINRAASEGDGAANPMELLPLQKDDVNGISPNGDQMKISTNKTPKGALRRNKKLPTRQLLPFAYSSYTLACERHPHRNEDSILTERPSGLVAVFDGVGGSAAGEIASQSARRATLQGWKHARQQIRRGFSLHSLLTVRTNINLCKLLEQLIAEADELVRTEGAHQAGTDDLATTVAISAFCQIPEKQEYTMAFGHVGDSRIYLLRENEPLRRLTADDGLLGRLVENTMVNENDAQRIDQAMRTEDLTDVELSYFRLRGGITQALGGPIPPTIHVDQVTIYPGDRILLCTDGIHDNLTDTEIEEIVRNSPRVAVSRLLVEQALIRSRQERAITIRAKPDDMSAIVLTCRL